MKHGAAGTLAVYVPQHSLEYSVLGDGNSGSVPGEARTGFPRVGCIDRRRVEGHQWSGSTPRATRACITRVLKIMWDGRREWIRV